MLFSSPPNEAFDLVTRIVARTLAAPMAVITVVAGDRQYFKSAIGLPEPWESQRQSPISHSLCRHVVERGAPLIVADTRLHPLVCDNPAIEEIGLQAYVGVPLRRANGEILGVLCAMDFVPHVWSDADLETLTDLATSVVTELEWRQEREEAIRQEGADELQRRDHRYRALASATEQITWITAPSGRLVNEQPAWAAYTGQREEEYLGFGWLDAIHPDDRARTAEAWTVAVAEGRNFATEYRARRHDGQYRTFEVRGVAVHAPDGNVREWVGMNVDITRRRQEEDERRFLAQASDIFAASIEYESTLHAVARVAVSRVADWCGIDVMEQGVLRRVATAHQDPSKEVVAQELLAFLRGRDATAGIAHVARTAEPALYENGHPALAGSSARDAEESRLIAQLGVTSAILMPLVHNGASIGVLTLARDGSGSNYTTDDMPLVEELAQRASAAVAHALLLRETEEARLQLQEQTVEMEEQLEELQSQATMLEEGQAELEELYLELQEGTVALRQEVRERELAEAAARAGELRMRAKLEASPIPTYLWRRSEDDLVLEECNSAARETTNGAIDRAIGTRARDIYPDGGQVLADLERCWREKTVIRRQSLNHRTLDGRERTLLVSHAYVAPDTVMVHAEDITEMARVTRALEATEERYRSVFEGAAEGFVVLERDADGAFRYLDVNPAMLCLRGWTRDEVIGRRPHDVLPAETADSITALLQRVLETEEPLEVERADEQYLGGLITRLRFTPLRNDGRAVSRILVSVEDVTARKGAEGALKESERWVRSVLESAPDVIFVHDLSGAMIDFNSRLATMLGYTHEEMERLDATELDADHSPDVLRRRWEAMQPGTSMSVAGAYRRKDGSRVPVEAALSRIMYGGRPVVLSITRDVTERVRLEDQLRQAAKMEAVGRLSGGVAHDFNNILQSIIGHTELMLEGAPDDSPLRDDLVEVRRSAGRAADLTRQLLAFSRQQVLQPRPLSLTQSVLDVQRMLSRMIGEDIEFVTRLQPYPGHVSADPTQVEQVIVNLAVNARDAMPKGGVLTVVVRDATLSAEDVTSAATKETPGEYVLLEVSDNGSGMNAATRARIFEPFYTTKGVGEGTGLGLATVYGIVTQSGGQIRVESAPDQGTRFQIYFPRLGRVATPEAKPTAAPSEVPRGSETILVVEDQDDVRQIAMRSLRRVGYTVIEARNGADALRALRAHAGTVALLLTDAVMPEMGGHELTERVQAEWPAMRVLCMSGYTPTAMAERGAAHPEMEFIQKPFTPIDLARRVREVIDRA